MTEIETLQAKFIIACFTAEDTYHNYLDNPNRETAREYDDAKIAKKNIFQELYLLSKS